MCESIQSISLFRFGLPFCGRHCVSDQSFLKCEISIEMPELVKQTEVAKGSPIDLLIHAWNIDYDVYFSCSFGFSSSSSYAEFACRRIRNKVVAGTVHDEICCDMPVFLVSPFREWWKCGVKRIKEKSIISGPIWTRRELESAWCGRTARVVARGDDEMAWKTFPLKNGYKNDVLGLQHAGVTNNCELSASFQPFERRACVSRGVVQCFMLCYHRTWWRRSGNWIRRKSCERAKWERKMLCMVVELLCAC